MVTCPYCDQAAELVTGNVIYPHRPDLFSKFFWRCQPCGAWVGCHNKGNGQGDGTQPLGRLANAHLRRAKSLAHAAFDPLWKSGRMTRHQAYAWLAQTMNVNSSDAHIGMFDEVQCHFLLRAVRDLRDGR